MNIRKEIDYSAMYIAMDSLMEQELPQMGHIRLRFQYQLLKTFQRVSALA